MNAPLDLCWRLSLHEAAHAIVADAVGAQLLYAVVTSGSGGMVKCRASARAFPRAMIAYAGMIAEEEMHIPRPADLTPEPGAVPTEAAIAAAAPIVKAAGLIDDEALIDALGLSFAKLAKARTRVRDILEARRPSLVAVARALAERGAIGQEDWAALLAVRTVPTPRHSAAKPQPPHDAAGASSMLNEIMAKLRARKREKAGSFLALAKDIAHGQHVEVEDVEAMLAESGRSEEDLAAAVAVAEKRIALARVVDAAADVDAELAEVGRSIGKADAALAKAREAHRKATAPLRERADELRMMRRRASEARRELARTCPDAALRERATAASAEREAVGKRAAELRAAIEMGKPAAVASMRAESRGSPLGALADRAEKNRDAAAAELPTVQRRIEELDRDEAELHRQLVEA